MALCVTCLVRSRVNSSSPNAWGLGREERLAARRHPSSELAQFCCLSAMDGVKAGVAGEPCMKGVLLVASPARRFCLFLITPGRRV